MKRFSVSWSPRKEKAPSRSHWRRLPGNGSSCRWIMPGLKARVASERVWGIKASPTRQAFRKRNQLCVAAVRLPGDAPIVEHACDASARRSPQRLHAIARLESSGLAKAVDNLNHAAGLEHSGHTGRDFRRFF